MIINGNYKAQNLPENSARTKNEKNTQNNELGKAYGTNTFSNEP